MLSSSQLPVWVLIFVCASLFLEGIKNQPTRLVARITAGMDDNRIELGEDFEVDLIESDARGDVPDVVEGYSSELTSPGHSDANTYIRFKIVSNQSQP